ncbi:cupin domain-containing protein [Streptomyces sp. RB6PN25]|uniref:Cupin domain-containing protein n=1 Tax=Streptomyces humicola TaxID=2953240 RepID=A0ABT1Q301_9ACTN|nr:cupin domain-containing protein [Streptomyces humicola]MCQ4084264.1 cupin domain-containing protein [Streptomyces humicola]
MTEAIARTETGETGEPSRLKFSVDEAKPNRKRGGDIRVTLSPVTVGSTSGFGGILYLEPGEFVTEHYHPYSEEFLHVISGELEITLDGKPVALGAGDSLLVPIGVRHRLVNSGQARAHCAFHLSPLAPRPELGHVDTETVANPQAADPRVGGTP